MEITNEPNFAMEITTEPFFAMDHITTEPSLQWKLLLNPPSHGNYCRTHLRHGNYYLTTFAMEITT
jgi:hypothetical protein